MTASEKPILFSPEMMLANLAGIKTQTRQVIKGVDGKTGLLGRIIMLCIARNSARDAYAALIDAINGAGTWASNPWMWVINYKIIEVRR